MDIKKKGIFLRFRLILLLIPYFNLPYLGFNLSYLRESKILYRFRSVMENSGPVKTSF